MSDVVSDVEIEVVKEVVSEEVINVENLNLARRKLNMVLADKAPVYFTLMKQWFQMKRCKDTFDSEARKMMNPEQVRYHNEFLLALLKKVGGLAETSVSLAHERAFSFGINKRSGGSTSPFDPDDVHGFDPVDLGDYVTPKSPQGAGSDGVKYVAQEVFLPDQSLIIGRFMLAAWDHDLDGVEDEAADIVVLATQTLLKNVLQAVITRRKPCKTKGRFCYDMGADVPNMWLRNTSKVVNQGASGSMSMGAFGAMEYRRPTVDEMEHAVAMNMACSVPQEEVTKISVEDVYETLLANRNIIASQTIYSVNLERIANMLSHPSY